MKQEEATAPVGEARDAGTPTDDAEAKPKNAASREKRRHGKGFVYISLKDCDDALKKIDPNAKTMSVGQFASSLGHNAPKGRFQHKVDALKTFGLIENDTSEVVTLSQLGEDMLYGADKAKARTTAFLNCAEFKKLYVDFPKSHDNARDDLLNYVRAKIGIVTEVDRFYRLFLESAAYAGLLEGTANPDAKIVRLRSAPMSGGSSGNSAPVTEEAGEQYAVLPADEVDDLLDGAGLTEFKQRSEVRQRATGRFTLEVGEGGRITIEITRPIRITVKPENLIADLPRILEALNQKGLQA